MLLDPGGLAFPSAERTCEPQATRRWGVSSETGRLNRILERSGFDVVEIEIDQFTRCGGGVHCLTMPLARLSDPPSR